MHKPKFEHACFDDCRLQQCPQCLYNLTGLPTEGRCPECGVEYDTNILGIPACNPDNIYHNTIQWVFFGIVSIPILVLGTWIWALIPSLPRASFLLVLCGSIAPLPVLQQVLYRWRMKRGKRDCMAVLCAKGIALRTRWRCESWHPWSTYRNNTTAHHVIKTRDVWRVQLKRRLSLYMILHKKLDLLCTKRQAALLRSELNRRIREARQHRNDIYAPPGNPQ